MCVCDLCRRSYIANYGAVSQLMDHFDAHYCTLLNPVEGAMQIHTHIYIYIYMVQPCNPPSPPVMVMVRRIMCMEGLSHTDMLPPPRGGSMFVFYVCTPPVMVLRMMCMGGLSHGDTLPPPPLWVWEGGCGGSMFVFYVCTPP